ncbi:MAG: hypothetical protein JNM43_04310 [Planctomycetaceae bacterium]|nr:hypothetical protein [Planctomycetaceae bacterium]
MAIHHSSIVSLLGCIATGLMCSVAVAQTDRVTETELVLPDQWEYSAPLISPENRETDRSHAQKDPSIVFHDGRWHVFMTVKIGKRPVREYCSFTDWNDANAAPRHLLTLIDRDYFCAPQVFFFEPHGVWYLIYQVGNPGSRFMAVAYSTTKYISDPNSWTQAKFILDGSANDPRKEGGLDYWVICDEQRAYLFLTTNNGKMWRLWTELSAFPGGFGHCELALQGDIFEASHTYRIQGRKQYLTLIEADGQRYFKAYVSDRLDGEWTEIRIRKNLAFAESRNIHPASGVSAWTDNVSHGELIRSTNDQTLTIDPARMEFVFQGMLQSEKAGKPYGQFPWRIGLLRPASQPASDR